MFIHYQQLVSRRGLVDKIPVRMSEVPGSIPVTSHILKKFTTFFVRYENFLLPISSLIMLPFASFKKEMYCTPEKKKNYQHPSIDIPHLALHFFILSLYHRVAVLQKYFYVVCNVGHGGAQQGRSDLCGHLLPTHPHTPSSSFFNIQYYFTIWLY